MKKKFEKPMKTTVTPKFSPVVVDLIDEMIDKGYGSCRSEIVELIVIRYLGFLEMKGTFMDSPSNPPIFEA